MATTWVPMGAQVPVLSLNHHPNPSQGRQKSFGKGRIFENLAGVTKQPTQRLFQGFWGGHGSGYMGLAATMRVPMGAQVPVLSLNHHPNPSRGRQKGFGKKSNSIAFGKSTSQRIYREQHTPKIGWKLHKYRLKHALHTLDDHFR